MQLSCKEIPGSTEFRFAPRLDGEVTEFSSAPLDVAPPSERAII
jgi:hypothetical protein